MSNISTTSVKSTIDMVAGWIRWACDLIIVVGLALLIAALVLSKFNLIRVGFIPLVNETTLAWMAGAFWLYRGGRLH